jgi:hypothetical protein
MAVKRDDNFQLSDILTGTPRCDRCRTWHWPADRHVSADHAGIETVAVGNSVIRLTRALGRGSQGAVLAGRTDAGGDVVVKAAVSATDVLVEEVELYGRLRLTEADELLHRRFTRDHGLRSMPLPLLLGFATTMSPRYSALAAVTMAGPSLYRVREHMRKSGCTFGGVNVTHVMTCVTAALEYLAGQGGMVHADIKPENICIGPPGRTGDIVLIDMGLVHEVQFVPWVPYSRNFIGTPDYASVMQYRGWGGSFIGDIEGLFYTLVDCVGELPTHLLTKSEALALREFIAPWSRVASHSPVDAEDAARKLLLLSGVPADSSAYAPLLRLGTAVYTHADHGQLTIGHERKDMSRFYKNHMRKHPDFKDGDGEYASPAEFYAEIRRLAGVPVVYPAAFDEVGEQTRVFDGVRAWLRQDQTRSPVTALLAAHAGEWERVATDLDAGSLQDTITYTCDHAPDAVWTSQMTRTLSASAWGHATTAVGLRRLLTPILDKGDPLSPHAILILALDQPDLLPELHALVPTLPIAAYIHVADVQGGYNEWGPWTKHGEFDEINPESPIEKIVAIGRIFAEYGYSWSSVTHTTLSVIGLSYQSGTDSIEFRTIMNSRYRDEFTMYTRQIPGWTDIIRQYAANNAEPPFTAEQIHAEIARRANVM